MGCATPAGRPAGRVLRTSLGACGAVAPQQFGTSGRGAVASIPTVGGGGERWWMGEGGGDHVGHLRLCRAPKQGMIF